MADTAELQDAIGGGASEGDTICLKAGIYLLSNNLDTFDVTVNNLTLIGKSHKTTLLDGNHVANHVMTVAHADVNKLTLKKLAVVNGFSDLENTDDGTSDTGQGAGLYIENADIKLVKVRVANNRLTGPQGTSTDFAGGAGLFARASNIHLEYSIVEANEATSSGGILVVGSTYPLDISPTRDPPEFTLNDVINSMATNGSLHISHSQIKNNVANGDIGGLLVVAVNSLKMENSTLLGNEARDNPSFADIVGGGYALRSLSVKIKESKLTGNIARWATGAFRFEDNLSVILDKTIISDNEVQGDFAFRGDGGGIGIFANPALAGNTARVVIKNSKFERNTAFTDGGALFAGRFTTGLSKLDISIKNTLFKDNLFGIRGFTFGGGMEVFNFGDVAGMTLNLKRVKFIDNKATNPSMPDSFGGAIDAFQVTFKNISKVSFRGNVAFQGGAATITASVIEKMSNVVFKNNQADLATLVVDSDTIVIKMKNVKFIDNPSLSVGALFIGNGASRIDKMTNVLFLRNTALGGGILGLGVGGGMTLNSTASVGVMKNVKFIKNEASTLTNGNAIFCQDNNSIGPFKNVRLIPNVGPLEQNIADCNILPW